MNTAPKALIDSENLINILRSEGYQIVSSYTDADLVVINTCGFINPAIRESLDTIAEAIAANGQVMVTGCLGKDKKLLLEKYPTLLHVSSATETQELLKAIHKFATPQIKPKQIRPGEPIERKIRLTPKHYAYLKIAEGCNNRCSFCIIPKLRGPLQSRLPRQILKEAQQLVDQGVKELILIAQDTLAYGMNLKLKNANLFYLLERKPLKITPFKEVLCR